MYYKYIARNNLKILYCDVACLQTRRAFCQIFFPTTTTLQRIQKLSKNLSNRFCFICYKNIKNKYDYLRRDGDEVTMNWGA